MWLVRASGGWGVPRPGGSKRPSPAADQRLSGSSTGLLLKTNFILLEVSWKGGAGVMETGPRGPCGLRGDRGCPSAPPAARGHGVWTVHGGAHSSDWHCDQPGAAGTQKLVREGSHTGVLVKGRKRRVRGRPSEPFTLRVRLLHSPKHWLKSHWPALPGTHRGGR